MCWKQCLTQKWLSKQMILCARRGTRQLELEVLTDYRIRSVTAQYILQSFIPPVLSKWILKLWSKLISWYLQILLITTPCPHGLQKPHFYKSFASDVDWGKDARQVETACQVYQGEKATACYACRCVTEYCATALRPSRTTLNQLYETETVFEGQ